MGRTIRSATQTWIEEEKALSRFTRALRKDDQQLLQELTNLSRLHIAEASYASNLYPMDIYLISMLLETYKKLRRTENKVAQLCKLQGIEPPPESEIPDLPSLTELIEHLDEEP
ncbi:hypothetical protein [Flexilinea flocculi]|jgi:hypothetical protein|uniref:DUF8156 domain-containing protein n=1 Tax=Flexilinea flocculi TaxID=1678840 RepID=A0A0S7BN41_9CHLR|nr:hypothetical protein [Flexilinea flocculi]NMB94234.1 hypothetical protein [Flexilinea flocculi]GAP41724.1 hypothetical protein ATC1_131720 [Flexilinea flocculi]